MNTDKHNKMRMSFGFFALLMSFSLLIAACTTQTTVQQPAPAAPEAPAPEPVPEPAEPVEAEPEPVPEEEAEETVEIETNKKPAEEEHEETVEQLVADGTYTDVVDYNSPGGVEEIEISITVENDVVTAVTLDAAKEPHSVSAKYIKGVSEALPDLVVGKQIDQLNVPVQISGSSLTTAAFVKYVDELL